MRQLHPFPLPPPRPRYASGKVLNCKQQTEGQTRQVENSKLFYPGEKAAWPSSNLASQQPYTDLACHKANRLSQLAEAAGEVAVPRNLFTQARNEGNVQLLCGKVFRFSSYLL